MINEKASWDLIRYCAIKAFKTKMIWHSLIENAPYAIKDITDNYLLIKRLNGGVDVRLTKNKVIKTAKRLDFSNLRIKRRTLISTTVAEETAFVLFHPQLTWSEDGDYILYII